MPFVTEVMVMDDVLHPVFCRWVDDGVEHAGRFHTDAEGGFCFDGGQHRLTDAHGVALRGVESLRVETVDLRDAFGFDDMQAQRYVQGMRSIGVTRWILEMRELNVLDDAQAGRLLRAHLHG